MRKYQNLSEDQLKRYTTYFFAKMIQREQTFIFQLKDFCGIQDKVQLRLYHLCDTLCKEYQYRQSNQVSYQPTIYETTVVLSDKKTGSLGNVRKV